MVMRVLSAEEGSPGRTAEGAGDKEVGERHPVLADQTLECGHLGDHPGIEISSSTMRITLGRVAALPRPANRLSRTPDPRRAWFCREVGGRRDMASEGRDERAAEEVTSIGHRVA